VIHRRPLLLAALIATIALARSAVAQNCSYTGTNGSCSINLTSSLTVNRLLRLTINDTSTAAPAPTEADYDLGYQQFAPLTATVKTNGTWSLGIRATAATFTASGGARANKPAADLQRATAAGGPYAAVTTTNTTLTSGTAGAANVVNLFYRILWSYTVDTPGTYRITVVYTLTAP
jgi:hypothetical protein